MQMREGCRGGDCTHSVAMGSGLNTGTPDLCLSRLYVCVCSHVCACVCSRVWVCDMCVHTYVSVMCVFTRVWL